MKICNIKEGEWGICNIEEEGGGYATLKRGGGYATLKRGWGICV